MRLVNSSGDAKDNINYRSLEVHVSICFNIFLLQEATDFIKLLLRSRHEFGHSL